MSDRKMNSKCIEYLEGLLSAEEMQDFEQLLAADPALARLFEEYKELLGSERILKDTTWTTPQGFESRLFTRIAAENQYNHYTILRRLLEVFEYLGRPTQVRVGVIATVFLLSFSVLVARNVAIQTPSPAILNERIESPNYGSVQPSPQSTTTPSEAFSTAPEVPPTTAERILDEESDTSRTIELNREPAQREQQREAIQHKKAKSASPPPVQGIPLEEPSFKSESGSARARALGGDDVPATANSAPAAAGEDVPAFDSLRSRVVTESTPLSRHSSSTTNQECQSEHVVVNLRAAQQIFELPSKDAKVIYTTTDPVRAIVCRKVSTWTGLRYLEGELCPWALPNKKGAECPIGWVILKNSQ